MSEEWGLAFGAALRAFSKVYPAACFLFEVAGIALRIGWINRHFAVPLLPDFDRLVVTNHRTQMAITEACGGASAVENWARYTVL